jgi:hypothetical protein
VLEEWLRQEWHARERAVPISSVLRFAPEGLVLGAGTVLVAAEETRRLRVLQGQHGRVLALLSAAYGKPVEPRVLGNIERAMKCWRDGDDCLAYIHLAHAGLPQPQEPYEAARRLFMTDGVMKAGISPRAIFEALGCDAAYVDTVEKLYNPDEPRVPAGSGRTSGQWTRLLSILGDLTAEAAESLGRFGAGLVAGTAGDAVAAFGLLFIPSPNDVRVEGDVSGMPGLHYAWDRDESLLHLTYDDADGTQHTFTAALDDDVFRDSRGQIVGRILPDGTVAIDTAAVSADLVEEDEPKLCPAPGPDKPGGSERGRDYEDYVKSIVNPPPLQTPRGIGFRLPNPQNSDEPVYFDDCEHATGTMVEAKGDYANVLAFFPGNVSVYNRFLIQSGAQVAAAAGRPIRWYFAEAGTAAFAEELFQTAGGGRERIEIVILPWPGSGP